jgi:hypothetical protein
MPTPEIVALLLAALLRRSKLPRGRISEKTLKLIAARKNVRGAFESQLSKWLDDYGVGLLSLVDRGGWALVDKSSLESAPPIAADRLQEELTNLRSGTFEPSAIIRELGYDPDENVESLETDAAIETDAFGAPLEPASPPSPAAAPAWTLPRTVREARPGSKRRIAADVMRMHPNTPKREVLPLIVAAEGPGFTLGDAKSYYRYIVAHGLAPGESLPA